MRTNAQDYQASPVEDFQTYDHNFKTAFMAALEVKLNELHAEVDSSMQRSGWLRSREFDPAQHSAWEVFIRQSSDQYLEGLRHHAVQIPTVRSVYAVLLTYIRAFSFLMQRQRYYPNSLAITHPDILSTTINSCFTLFDVPLLWESMPAFETFSGLPTVQSVAQNWNHLFPQNDLAWVEFFVQTYQEPILKLTTDGAVQFAKQVYQILSAGFVFGVLNQAPLDQGLFAYGLIESLVHDLAVLASASHDSESIEIVKKAVAVIPVSKLSTLDQGNSWLTCELLSQTGLKVCADEHMAGATLYLDASVTAPSEQANASLQYGYRAVSWGYATTLGFSPFHAGNIDPRTTSTQSEIFGNECRFKELELVRTSGQANTAVFATRTTRPSLAPVDYMISPLDNLAILQKKRKLIQLIESYNDANLSMHCINACIELNRHELLLIEKYGVITNQIYVNHSRSQISLLDEYIETIIIPQFSEHRRDQEDNKKFQESIKPQRLNKKILKLWHDGYQRISRDVVTDDLTKIENLLEILVETQQALLQEKKTIDTQIENFDHEITKVYTEASELEFDVFSRSTCYDDLIKALHCFDDNNFQKAWAKLSDVQRNDAMIDGVGIMHYTTALHALEPLRIMLKSNPKLIYQVDRNGFQPLHYLMVIKHSARADAILELFIQYHAPLDQYVGESSLSVFHLAVQRENIAFILRLLRLPAALRFVNQAASDEQNETPLEMALRLGNDDIVVAFCQSQTGLVTYRGAQPLAWLLVREKCNLEHLEAINAVPAFAITEMTQHHNLLGQVAILNKQHYGALSDAAQSWLVTLAGKIGVQWYANPKSLQDVATRPTDGCNLSELHHLTWQGYEIPGVSDLEYLNTIIRRCVNLKSLELRHCYGTSREWRVFFESMSSIDSLQLERLNVSQPVLENVSGADHLLRALTKVMEKSSHTLQRLKITDVYIDAKNAEFFTALGNLRSLMFLSLDRCFSANNQATKPLFDDASSRLHNLIFVSLEAGGDWQQIADRLMERMSYDRALQLLKGRTFHSGRSNQNSFDLAGLDLTDQCVENLWHRYVRPAQLGHISPFTSIDLRNNSHLTARCLNFMACELRADFDYTFEARYSRYIHQIKVDRPTLQMSEDTAAYREAYFAFRAAHQLHKTAHLNKIKALSSQKRLSYVAEVIDRFNQPAQKTHRLKLVEALLGSRFRRLNPGKDLKQIACLLRAHRYQYQLFDRFSKQSELLRAVLQNAGQPIAVDNVPAIRHYLEAQFREVVTQLPSRLRYATMQEIINRLRAFERIEQLPQVAERVLGLLREGPAVDMGYELQQATRKIAVSCTVFTTPETAWANYRQELCAFTDYIFELRFLSSGRFNDYLRQRNMSCQLIAPFLESVYNFRAQLLASQDFTDVPSLLRFLDEVIIHNLQFIITQIVMLYEDLRHLHHEMEEEMGHLMRLWAHDVAESGIPLFTNHDPRIAHAWITHADYDLNTIFANQYRGENKPMSLIMTIACMEGDTDLCRLLSSYGASPFYLQQNAQHAVHQVSVPMHALLSAGETVLRRSMAVIDWFTFEMEGLLRHNAALREAFKEEADYLVLADSNECFLKKIKDYWEVKVVQQIQRKYHSKHGFSAFLQNMMIGLNTLFDNFKKICGVASSSQRRHELAMLLGCLASFIMREHNIEGFINETQRIFSAALSRFSFIRMQSYLHKAVNEHRSKISPLFLKGELQRLSPEELHSRLLTARMAHSVDLASGYAAGNLSAGLFAAAVPVYRIADARLSALDSRSRVPNNRLEYQPQSDDPDDNPSHSGMQRRLT